VAADAALCTTSPEVTLLEVVEVRRMDGPVVALAVGAATGLNKAVIQG